MITFSRIGQYGRLGNQIFQYSMLFGLSKKKGYDFCIPKTTGCMLGDVFESIRFGNPTGIKQAIQEPIGYGTGVYIEDIESIPDNSDICGYFQCPLYFQHCSDSLKEHLQIKKKYTDAADSFIASIGVEDLGFIHVRRGDYLQISDCHPPITVDHIKNAIEISKSKKFVVLSDDIRWCRENLGFADIVYSPFSEGEVGYDFALMTRCKSAIIANSSFSWWGAWLGTQKDVIAPKNWFGKGKVTETIPKSWDNIYCKDWTIL